MSAPWKPGTLAVWGGEQGPLWERATQVPVVHSVSFGYPDMEEWLAVARGEQPGHIYARQSNPTVEVFSESCASSKAPRPPPASPRAWPR